MPAVVIKLTCTKNYLENAEYRNRSEVEKSTTTTTTPIDSAPHGHRRAETTSKLAALRRHTAAVAVSAPRWREAPSAAADVEDSCFGDE